MPLFDELVILTAYFERKFAVAKCVYPHVPSKSMGSVIGTSTINVSLRSLRVVSSKDVASTMPESDSRMQDVQDMMISNFVWFRGWLDRC